MNLGNNAEAVCKAIHRQTSGVEQPISLDGDLSNLPGMGCGSFGTTFIAFAVPN